MQAVHNRHDSQNSQESQATYRYTAHQIIPVDKGVKVPAVVHFGLDCIGPAQRKFSQKNRNEHGIVENEVFVDRVVGGLKCWKVLFQHILDSNEVIDRIPDNKREVDDDQAQHQKIDNQPGELVTGLQVLAVNFQHSRVSVLYGVIAFAVISTG